MLKKLYRVIVNALFWSYERGTWQYDLMCLAIVLFILLTPRDIFNDRPLEFSPAREVVLLQRQATTGLAVYRIQARLMAHNPRASAEELLRKKLKKKIEIAHLEPVTNEDGAVLWYDVTVRE